MTDTNLISKFLHAGDRIRIGRNRACELVIPCPNLSGLHCAVEVKKTSESPRPSPFDGSGLTKCTVVDLSSNGTWLIKSEEDVARPKKLKKGVMADLCPGDCIMLLAPKHELCMQHRFVLRCNSAMKGEAGSAEFVLVQLPWEGGDLSTVTMEEVPRRKPSGSGKLDSKSDDLRDRVTIASTKDDQSTRKRKSSCEPESGKLGTIRDLPNLKKSRLEATCSLSDNATTNASKIEFAVEERRNLKTDEICSSKMLNSPKLVDCEVQSRISVEMVAKLDEYPIPSITSSNSVPSLTREVSRERCPTCLKLFPIMELPTHCAICQRTADHDTSCGESTSHSEEDHDTPDGTAALLRVENTVMAAPSLLKEISLEQCPICLKLFPVLELMAHAEVCMRECSRPSVGTDEAGIDMSMRMDIAVSKSRESETDSVVSEPTVTSTPSSLVPPSMPTVEVSVEECPSCLKLFPLCELVEHSEMCRSRRKAIREEVKAPEPKDADNRSRYNLESYVATNTGVGTSSTFRKKGEKEPDSVSSQVGTAACGTSGELEQCFYCLKDFPLPELIYHVENCHARDRSKVSWLSLCQSQRAV